MNLRIERWIYGGTATERAEDGTSHSLSFVIPGELVQIGEDTVEPVILEASPDRVAPRCPHFGVCGGCQYQHVAYDAQSRLKAGILHDVLTEAGLTHLPAIQVHTADPWQYRNRIRLHTVQLDGVLRFGYKQRGSQDVLPIVECPIAAPLLMRAAEVLLSELQNHAALAAQCSEVELFTNAEQSRLQMTLFLRRDCGAPILARLCEPMAARLPELAGAGVIVIGTSGRREQPGVRWGAPGLQYQVHGRSYWVSRESFFQVNRFLVDELVDLVTKNRSGSLAWDLYAGVGLFSRALAESFSRVVGVEIVAADLSTALRGACMSAVSATTADFLRSAVLQRDRPDLIVMDPPRAGVGAEVCELLARVKAPQMIYVSCDPTTLARDLRLMVDSGYTIQEVHMVDLFPQTFHLETVIVLNR